MTAVEQRVTARCLTREGAGRGLEIHATRAAIAQTTAFLRAALGTD